MKLFVGKIVACCPTCGGSDWDLVDPAQSFGVLSRIVCTQCGEESTYGDLVLQAPFEGETLSERGRRAGP